MNVLDRPVKCDWCEKQAVPPRGTRRVPTGWLRWWDEYGRGGRRWYSPLLCDECVPELAASAD